MPLPSLRSHAWLRPPRRTARLRFTLLYGGLFLLSGAALVAFTYGLFERATEYHNPHLPAVPTTPAIRDLQLKLARAPGPLGQALPQLTRDYNKLAAVTVSLVKGVAEPGFVPLLTRAQRQLSNDQHALVASQRQLAAAQHQLAAAVHQVARSGVAEAAQRAADSHQLLIDSGIALGVVALLALLAGWFVAGRMLRPIRKITRTARRISSARLHERLALGGPQDELKELGDTLDDLFDRLEASFAAQRNFAANASHELRTPLARQRALIQVALADPGASFASLRAAHERVLASEQHLEAMIDGLLTLTRGEAGLDHREQLDLAALAAQALLARDAELAERGLEVRAALDEAPAAGDPRLLERLIVNLVDNAIRHNSPDGEIEVTTATRAGRALLVVSNSGQLIPPEQIERLFQPFQRLDGARTRHNAGHGLGLSIVKAIATTHHAELSAHARPQGGLSVEVSFPAVTELGEPGSAEPPPLLALEAEGR